jgi:zinc protease
MLDEGTATRSALKLADDVAQLGASLSAGSSMDVMQIDARSLSKNFAATLDLVADVALQPAMPPE